jgi:hypothetical protein
MVDILFSLYQPPFQLKMKRIRKIRKAAVIKNLNYLNEGRPYQELLSLMEQINCRILQSLLA